MMAYYSCPFDFLSDLNNTINQAIQGCYPDLWNENDITAAILRGLVKKNQMFTISNNSRFIEKIYTIVEWEAFRLSGRIENDDGDVACYVQFNRPDRPPFAGIGYFETKKINTSGQFPGIRPQEQLSRLVRLMPHHHTVLYDYDYLTQIHDHPHALYGYKTNCGTVPTNLLSTLSEKSRDLYRYAVSLAELLFCRYFCGLDLEFDQPDVAHILSPIPPHTPLGGGGIQRPSYLIVAHVCTASSEEKLSSILQPRRTYVSDDYLRLSSASQRRP